MPATEDLEAWLAGASEKVRRNVTIETPASLGVDRLLHISSDTAIRKFIPQIGRRQAKQEDRTVPRICCAPTLLGCMIGYAKTDDDFQTLKSSGSKDDAGYRGGWKIYGFPFEAALKPTGNLVWGAATSAETWLNAYNRETAEYAPEALGKLFYRSIRLLGRSGNVPVGEMELYAEITHERGLAFSKDHFLKKGCWVVEGPMHRNVRSWKDDKDFRVRQIDRAQYFSAKAAHADLLSLK